MLITQFLRYIVGLIVAGVGTASPVGLTAPHGAVPQVMNHDVISAYAAVRSAGFAVAIGAPFTILDELQSPPVVTATAPAPGRRASPGSTVVLTIAPCPTCPLGSPAVPTHIPRYRVPDFVGKPASTAFAWVTARDLYWTAHLGPLRHARSTTLYGNYRVTYPQPKPEANIQIGTGIRAGTSGTFTPTPLTVWGTQERSQH